MIIAMFWIFELHNSYSTRKLNKSTLNVTTKMLNTISCWEEFKTISFHQRKKVGNQLRREIYSRSFSTYLLMSKNGRLYSGHFLKPILFDNFLLGREYIWKCNDLIFSSYLYNVLIVEFIKWYIVNDENL